MTPPNDERRPREEAPPRNRRPDAEIVAPAVDIPVQVRRRRAASRRLPVLADGRRDPADPPRRGRLVMRRAISINTVEFVGADSAVFAAFKTLQIRYMRAKRGGAWLVHVDTADDVEALLTSRGYPVEAPL